MERGEVHAGGKSGHRLPQEFCEGEAYHSRNGLCSYDM